ncbi:hypothetical protein LCGC14_2690820, partial [marine sediment metagenome]
DGTDLESSVPILANGLFITTVGLDGEGAIDLDYGSGDITDHTFPSDDLEYLITNAPAVFRDGVVFIEVEQTHFPSPDIFAHAVDHDGSGMYFSKQGTQFRTEPLPPLDWK